ncbi:MAG: hypothetical protein QM770_17880 [Tepidisphaeraceae bacterium]
MLLQTNSYIVPKDKRTEHARLVKQFKQVMSRLGCDDFEVYEQAGPNWSTEVGGRFVQIMKFRDREHQRSIREAEQSDAVAQELVREFIELINFPYQHQQGLATTAFYIGVVTAGDSRGKAVRKIVPPGIDPSSLKAIEETPISEAEKVEPPATQVDRSIPSISALGGSAGETRQNEA